MKELEDATREAHVHISESDAFVSQNPISLLVQNDFQQVLASTDTNIRSMETMIPTKEQVRTLLWQALKNMPGGVGADDCFDLSFCREKLRALSQDMNDISQKQKELSRLSHIQDNLIIEDIDTVRQNFQDHLAAGESRFSKTRETRDFIRDIPLYQDRKNAAQVDIERFCTEFGGDADAQKHAIENLEEEWASLEDRKKVVEKKMTDAACLSSIERDMEENQRKMDDVLLRQQRDMEDYSSLAIDEKTLLALKERLASFTRDYTSLDTVVQYIKKLEIKCHASAHPVKSALQIEMLREQNKNIVFDSTATIKNNADISQIITYFVKDKLSQDDKTEEETLLFCFENDTFASYLSEKVDMLRKQAQNKRERQDVLITQSERQRSLYDESRQKQEGYLAHFETIMQERPAMRMVVRKEDPRALRKTLDELKECDDDAYEIARARRFVEAYPSLEPKIKQYHNICSLLEECEDYPFNPACAACLNHPWKKKRESLLSTQRDLEVCLTAAAASHDCTMCELSEKHSHFSHYLNRVDKRKDEIEQLERRVREAREVCEAEKRESAWCQQKDRVQEELSRSKEAYQMAQEDLHKSSSEIDILKQELAALVRSITLL